MSEKNPSPTGEISWALAERYKGMYPDIVVRAFDGTDFYGTVNIVECNTVGSRIRVELFKDGTLFMEMDRPDEAGDGEYTTFDTVPEAITFIEGLEL